MGKTVSFIAIMLISVISAGASNGAIRSESGNGFNNIGFIESGTKWEVEVKGVQVPETSVTNVIQWLDGTEEINGREYMKLWVKIGDGDFELASYIRVDRDEMEVYAVSPDDLERGECRIYDFRPHSGYRTITPVNWDGTLSENDILYNVGKSVNGGWESCGYRYSAWDVDLYVAEEDDMVSLGKVNWIYGIGSPAGFLNQCYSVFDGVTTELIKVETSCSGVVYENKTAGLSTAMENVATDGIKYRPDGTIFREGDKGIYIMNGKKYIQH